MIKVRVDWHSQCPGCGAQLAVDFLENSADCTICPWCGYLCEIDYGPDQEKTRLYIQQAIIELEEKANAKSPA